MASEDAPALAAWIAGHTMRDTHLTFAAEFMGLASDRSLVLRTLLPLLYHPLPLVREGALVGLGHHLAADLRKRLEKVIDEDPVPELRSIAAGFLEELPQGT